MAEVAGPGQFSKRTDKAVANANRSLPDAGYGEQAQYKEQLAAAPLPGSQDVTGMNFNDLFGNAAANVVPMDADPTMTNLPVTDGADAGAGADSSTLSSSNTQKNYMAAYMTALTWMADRPGSSDAVRNLVRNMKSKM